MGSDVWGLWHLITLHPYSPTETPTQCLPRETFSKRQFFPAVLTMQFAPPSNGAVLSCEERLIQAEAAYHNLMTGSMVQYIHHEGQTLQFTPGNRGDLQKYLIQLRSQCGDTASTTCVAGCGCAVCYGTRGRAMGISYV